MICIHRRRLHLCLRAGCRWRFRGNLCSVPERCEGRSDQACVRERPREGPRGPPSSAAAPRRSADDARGPHVTSKVLLSGGCVLTLGARTPNFHAGGRPDRRRRGGGGRHRPPSPGRRAGRRDGHDRHARLRGHASPHMDIVVPQPRRRRVERGRPVGERPTISRPTTSTPQPSIGLLGAAEAGITTVVDWSPRRPDDGLAEAALQAHADAGAAHGVRPRRRTPSASASRGLRDAARAVHPVAFGRVAPAGPLGGAAAAWAAARDLGLRIHVHAEPRTVGTASSPARRSGLLGEDVTLVHRSGLDDADVGCRRGLRGVGLDRALERDGARAPDRRRSSSLIDHDIRPGLGVDDERVTPGRHVRADAGDDLVAARNGVRPQAGGQGRRSATDEHAGRHPLRDGRRSPGGGVGGRDRVRWRPACRPT